MDRRTRLCRLSHDHLAGALRAAITRYEVGPAPPTSRSRGSRMLVDNGSIGNATGDQQSAQFAGTPGAASLAHQVVGMLAAGWTVEGLRAALDASPTAAEAPDPAAQEKRWRSELKLAKHVKRQPWQPDADAP